MKICATCGTQYADDQKFCPKDGSALRSTTQGNLIGSVIADRYHILKKLGEGGMGAVYLGEHVKMGRKSAIKVMTQSMASDADAIARFNREAANAARINHPNVCAIYDFGETADGLIYLAMEFIEGESLGDVLEREHRLPAARALTVLRQTADALQAAHDLGIVHRDLKPDNIMLARGRGGAEVVKVVDFGIAKAMTADEGQKVTKTGLVVGTPEYMSPEQLAGDVLDGRSDLYSLALVFYRMLTGTLPFPADSAQEMMIKRLTDEPLPLERARPGAGHPAALQRVMDRALARMPGERYPTATQFAQEAAAAAAGWGEGDAAAGGATQLMGAAAPDVTVKMAATVAGAPHPSGTAGPATTPRTPTTPRPAASPVSAPRRRAPALVIAAAVVLLGGGATAALMLGGGRDGTATEGERGLDGSVTDDTARGAVSPADSGRPTAPTDGAERERTGNGPGTPTTATVDSAAIDRELGDLLVQSEEAATQQAAATRALRILRTPGVPDNLRAFAAAIAAQVSYEQGDTPQACRLIAEARALLPFNAIYRRTSDTWSCSP